MKKAKKRAVKRLVAPDYPSGSSYDTIVLSVLAVLVVVFAAGVLSAVSGGDGVTGGVTYEETKDVLTRWGAAYKDITADIYAGQEPTDFGVFVLRSLFILLVFAVLYGVSGIVPFLGEQRNIRIVVVLVISFIAGLGIPLAFLVTLMRIYGAVFVVLLGGGPAFGTMYFAVSVEGKDRMYYLGKSLLASLAAVLFILTGNGLEVFTGAAGAAGTVVSFVSWVLTYVGGWGFFIVYAFGYCFLMGTIFTGEGAKHKAYRAAPRFLTRAARWAQKSERLVDTDKDKVDELVTELGGWHTPQAADVVPALQSKLAILRPMVEAIGKLKDDFRKRAENVALDMLSRSKGLGDPAIEEETLNAERWTHGARDELKNADDHITKAEGTLTTAVSVVVAGAAGRQITRAEELAIKINKDAAVRALKTASDNINKLLALDRDIMRKISEMRREAH